jgi:hypothetical protein
MIFAIKVTRDARTGRFTTLWYARRHRKTTVVETIIIMRGPDKRWRSR